MSSKALLLLPAAMLFAMQGSHAQIKLGNNPAAINASALLELESTNKGFLPVRMMYSQRNAIASPAEGLVVYQTDSVKGLYEYQGGTWKRFMTNLDIQRYTASGTGSLAMSSNTGTYALVPGLTQTFTLAAPATVIISADVSVWNNGSGSGDYATADLALLADNAYVTNAGRSRITVTNPDACSAQAYGSVTLHAAITLAAGSHTIQVKAARIDGTWGTQLNAGTNAAAAPYQSYLYIEATPK